jgi:hypothetical protein
MTHKTGFLSDFKAENKGRILTLAKLVEDIDTLAKTEFSKADLENTRAICFRDKPRLWDEKFTFYDNPLQFTREDYQTLRDPSKTIGIFKITAQDVYDVEINYFTDKHEIGNFFRKIKGENPMPADRTASCIDFSHSDDLELNIRPVAPNTQIIAIPEGYASYMQLLKEIEKELGKK